MSTKAALGDAECRAKGYFKVNHSIFEDSRLRDLSGDSFRVFLWMSSRAWRFPHSRGFLRASISMVRLCTGVSDATVSRALSELQKVGLIQVIKVDRKNGNQWWVKAICEIPQNECTQIELPQNEGVVPSKRGIGSLKMIAKIPRNEGHIISIKEVNKKEEAETLDLAWKVFLKEFPLKEDRDRELTNMIANQFVGVFKPPQKVMENLVVREWFHSKVR